MERLSITGVVTALTAVLWAFPVPAYGQRGDSALPYDGSDLFQRYCASCHGANAQGNGPMTSHLRTTPPDLTALAARNGGVFPSMRVERIIDGRDVGPHGNPEMPVWGDAFRVMPNGHTEASVRARIRALVDHLSFIQRRSAD